MNILKRYLIFVFSILLFHSNILHGTPFPVDSIHFLESRWESIQGQLTFEANKGQFSDTILYQAEVYGGQVRFTEQGASYVMIREKEHTHMSQFPSTRAEKFRAKIGYLEGQEAEYEGLVWNTTFKGGSLSPTIKGEAMRSEQIHYFKGNQASSWIRNAHRYRAITYKSIYDHIDVSYYGTEDHQLKYDFILHAGAEVDQIQVAYQGVDYLEVNKGGQLIIHTAWGEVIEATPYSYQHIFQYEQEVNVIYKLIDSTTLGFEIIGPYDPTTPLIIDPIVVNWSSFVHSSTSDDYLMAIDTDDEGNVYATGYTKTHVFPITPGVYQNEYGGGLDSYLAKLSPNGERLLYASYMGGSDWELAYGIDINEAGDIFIGGFTRSTDFPTTLQQTGQGSSNGFIDIFILCLSPEGDNLVFGTYIGGSDRDYLYDLSLGPQNEIYFTGHTLSDDFPITENAFQGEYQSGGDAFIARLDQNGNKIQFASYLGGDGYEIGQDIYVNEEGEAMIVGNTNSRNFPTTAGTVQPLFAHEQGKVAEDGFIAQFNAIGNQLTFSSYLGGTDGDGIYAVDLGVNGELYLTGVTYSEDFPTSPNAFQTSGLHPNIGGGDVFVTQLSPQADQFVYSTLIGGTDIEFSKAISVDELGYAHIVGASRSPNFPITENQSAHYAMYDVFLSKLSPDGTILEASTLIGGENNEYPRAASSLSINAEYITLGLTSHSISIPMAGETYQNAKMNGNNDAPLVVQVLVGNILPAFSAKWDAKWNVTQEQVDIDWNMDIQENYPLFIIQRKVEGMEWENIARYEMNEQPSLAFSYSDSEAATFKGKTLLYRLSILSEGGITQFSDIREVPIPLAYAPTLSIFPNPVEGSLELHFLRQHAGKHTFSLYQTDGKLLFKKDMIPQNTSLSIHSESLSWDLTGLSSGVYVIELNDYETPPIYAPFVKQ